MKYFVLIIFLVVINIELKAQNVDKEHSNAVKFINDSIDLYKEFKIFYPNKSLKKMLLQ